MSHLYWSIVILVLGGCPTRIRTMIDNPHLDLEDFRLSDVYFNQIRQVRKALED